MEIRGVNGQMGPGPVGPAGSQRVASDAVGAGSGNGGSVGDQVQISPAARYLSLYSSLPAVRSDKVAEARQSIADGTMDTDARLSLAIDRMLDDLLGR